MGLAAAGLVSACESIEAALPGTPVETVQPRLHPTNPPPPWPTGSYMTPASVEMKLCVDIRGVVTSAELTRSSGQPKFDEIALSWIRTARFLPATADGRPFNRCDFRYTQRWSGARPGG
jgi:TonB family protein